MTETEFERERHRQTDRQTETQRHRETERWNSKSLILKDGYSI